MKAEAQLSEMMGSSTQAFPAYKSLRTGFAHFTSFRILGHPWDFPTGPVGKTSPSSVGDVGLIPGRGAKVPRASWPRIKTETIL